MFHHPYFIERDTNERLERLYAERQMAAMAATQGREPRTMVHTSARLIGKALLSIGERLMRYATSVEATTSVVS